MADVHRIGFTHLLGGQGAGRGPYRVNIVFIHGLRGHPKHTWEEDPANSGETTVATSRKRRFNSLFRAKTSKSTADSKTGERDSVSSRLFWPDELLAHDIPEARVWTYGYVADVIGGLFEANNKNSVSQHGRDLAVRVEREIDNTDPIYFVAHSLGGIIVKDAMHKSETCRSRTKLIVFLGTPHRGSSYAGWGEIAANLARLALQDSNKRILETLEVNSEVLDNIHEEFKTIVHNSEIKIHSFQESQGMSGMKGLDNKVVDDFSSKLDLPRQLETVETINANHRQMAKCGDRSDPLYRAILGVLKQETSSHLLDDFPSHLRLRERRRIPYLTWLNWYKAIPLVGRTWGGETQVGLARIGMYSESWMNLLMIFGAASILTSDFIHQVPVDEDDIPQDIANPFAIELSLLANLVGIVGCDMLEFVSGMPVFTGSGARLEFQLGGSNTWIGRFTQDPGLPTRMGYAPRTVARASQHASGCIAYGFSDTIPLLESLARELHPQRLLQDLQLKAVGEIPFTLNQYEGLHPGEQRVIRAMLVFRAVLIAVRFVLGLDNSDFEKTELGSKMVFLR
ncbi:uncharacterized protein LMH87_008759 [Akanthomyces muscarius]|uniref:DUF676 domain-containing protein n=1 Tax=Akanthomyces muscarius TaxID=2231603 RepID=A0A9W8UPZ5_AKAMU|nr:uncharacterized protein LMH87_008759 [Akanthomyces muscarius]KAJ4158226.1 hypothetical protein LMH87_008759 [Akanthomyces muscarius]